MNTFVETAVIGGGQAGLSVSYFLSQQKQEHVVLEQTAQAGNAWRNRRWDSFTLVTPNWSFQLPGMAYEGDNPDGFMPRQEIVQTFEQYVARYHLPVQYGVQVTAVHHLPTDEYQIETTNETFRAKNVVMATGLYQQSKLPAFLHRLPASITQLSSDEYRNPAALPPGAVLVVGTGQSGCQIAEELQQNGRSVYLCVGSTGRAPRHYRGKDTYEWLKLAGFLDRTPDKLPSPKARFASNPHLTGSQGGRSINLHLLARNGVRLLGHCIGAENGRIHLAPNLHENLAKSDQFETQITRLIDGYIAQNHLQVAPEILPQWQDGFQTELHTELGLKTAGITTIIWAMGYQFNFDLVKLPITDEFGYPVQHQGATAFPGLYFVGLPWLTKMKSGLLLGVAEDAAAIAAHIISTRQSLPLVSQQKF